MGMQIPAGHPTNLSVTSMGDGGGAAPAMSGASSIMAARARDPKWNKFGAAAYPDQYALTGHGKSVTDAVNAGETVQPWAPSSGVGPGTRGYTGSFGQQPQDEYGGEEEMAPPQPFRTGRPASEISGRTRRMTSQLQPLAPSFYAKGTAKSGPIPHGQPFIVGDSTDGKENQEMVIPTKDGIEVLPMDKMPKMERGTRPHRDTRAPMSKAGRTGGLAKFASDQRRLMMEKAGRGARDPVSGMSQTPRDAEINAQLAALAAKPTEFPGFGGFEEAMLMSDYYNAKKSGNPDALLEATSAVQDYKNKLHAMRQQKAVMTAPLSQTDENPMGTPDLPTAAPIVAPTAAPIATPAPPPNGLAPATLIPGLAGRTASMSPTIAPRTITSKYGTGSITNAPRAGAPAFNLTDTYDPNFANKAKSLAEADSFQPVQQPAPMTGEGADFEAQVESPRDAWQKEAGRTVALDAESKARKQRDAERQRVDDEMSRGTFTAGNGGSEPYGMQGVRALGRGLLGGLKRIAPGGTFGR